VGKRNIGEPLLEGRLGYRCQRSYFLSFHPDILHGPDALGLEFVAPKFTIYRALCERLERIKRITDATECFYAMANELAWEMQDEGAKWVLGK
jgi:hypothetical protein